ncbi:MAG TPA: hypothetical protein VF974_07590 [Patescibacteria group bacterium]
MSSKHSGNIQPSIDYEEHKMPFGENSIAAKSVVQYVPSGTLSQKRLDYGSRTDANPIYVGYNIMGATTSNTNWLLQALTYDSSNRVILVQIATDAWDNRTTTTYS